MVRSLFLFDMTFWLYLAALVLYIAYLLPRRPVMTLASAGYPTDSFDERDGAWATQLAQIATLITVFGWVVNSGALFTLVFERMQTSGTFAPWSNQFEAMAYVSWAIILGYVLLELRYKIKAIGAFVVGIGFIAMGAASLLPYRYQTAERLVPALNSYWIYIHVSITLTSYAAFAMAGGLGVMYLFKERAERRGSTSRFYAAFPDLETIDELGYKAITVGFPLLRIGIILWGMWANYAWGGYWSWDPEKDLVTDRMVDLRRLHPCPHDARVGRSPCRHLCDLRVLDGGLLFLGGELPALRPARLCIGPSDRVTFRSP